MQRGLADRAFPQMAVQRIVGDEAVAEWLAGFAIEALLLQVAVEMHRQHGIRTRARRPGIRRGLRFELVRVAHWSMCSLTRARTLRRASRTCMRAAVALQASTPLMVA